MTEEINCSFFRHARDNHPRPWAGAWGRLLGVLRVDRIPVTLPAEHDPKKGLPALCGATFSPGSVRARGSVLAVQLLVLDVDNALEIPSGELFPTGRPVMVKVPMTTAAQLADMVGHLQAQGIAAYGWSTWSSTADWPRSRVVLPLASQIPPDLWPQAVEWILDHAGLNAWRISLDLPVMRDLARLHFLPALRPGGPAVERQESTGSIFAVPLEALSAVKVPEPALHSWQKEHLVQRGAGGHSWASRFRASDGTPLDLRTLDAVRLLESMGCRVGKPRTWGGGQKFRTSCPWGGEHSHGLDDDSAVLFTESGRWPTWHCSHSHHLHLGLVDLLDAAGVLQ